MSVRRIASLWGPLAAYLLLIHWVSGRSVLPAFAGLFSDKVLHVAAYAVLGVLAMRAFHGGIACPRLARSAASLALTVAYGAIDELHQAFVPGREADLRDLLADAIGGLLAIAALHVWTRRREARREAS